MIGVFIYFKGQHNQINKINFMENTALQNKPQLQNIVSFRTCEIEGVQSKQEREITTVKKRIFLEILEASRGIISATCQKADIARATYYVWMKTDPKFKESVQEIQAAKPDILEDRMYILALKGNFHALRYLMDKVYPNFKAQPNKNKETVVHIHHHATPLEEKEDSDIKLGLDELFIMAEENDLSQLTPMGMKTYKKYKQLAEFIKWDYGISDVKPKTREDFEKEKDAENKDGKENKKDEENKETEI